MAEQAEDAPARNNPLDGFPSRQPRPNPQPPHPAERQNPISRIRFGVTATVRATQHQIPSMAGTGRNTNNAGSIPPTTNNNAGEGPQQTQNLFHMRDRLFLALFFRVSLIYARSFPPLLRRFLEFCLLMQSIILLAVLVFIHVSYTRSPITCLGDYKDSWPKNGVLRVEITNNHVDYDLTKSYAKEERMRQRAAASQFGQYTDDFLSLMFTADSVLLDSVVSTAGGLLATVTGESTTTKPAGADSVDENVTPTSSIDSPQNEPPQSIATSSSETSIHNSNAEGGSSSKLEQSEDASYVYEGERKPPELPEMEEQAFVAAGEGDNEDNPEVQLVSPSISFTSSGEVNVGTPIVADYDLVDVDNPDSPFFNKTLEEIEIIKMQQRQLQDEQLLNSSVTDFEMFANSVWIQEQAYIVEYALEYGFLRLSPETRKKLGIPVKLVILDPTKVPCFGEQFSLFLLENFLGYDDILMSSIKNLAESEENKGYLRNVVTGEQFRFVPMWMARSSYIPALLIMLVFTVSISMLLRYSHHQIFVFIVDLLNNIEGAGSIHIPAAPLFTVILALVGMEAIMSEFFNDTSTAFYVILIVWIADQYDSVCSHTNITKNYWVRFFYLYHFAFYAYHYRFNGQYGGLALLVSWSFIQHSMVYFYHHYELPAILRQAHQPQPPSHPQPSEGNNQGGDPPPGPPPPPPNLPSSSSTAINSNSNPPSTSNPDEDYSSNAESHRDSPQGDEGDNNGNVDTTQTSTQTPYQNNPVSSPGYPHPHPHQHPPSFALCRSQSSPSLRESWDLSEEGMSAASWTQSSCNLVGPSATALEGSGSSSSMGLDDSSGSSGGGGVAYCYSYGANGGESSCSWRESINDRDNSLLGRVGESNEVTRCNSGSNRMSDGVNNNDCNLSPKRKSPFLMEEAKAITTTAQPMTRTTFTSPSSKGNHSTTTTTTSTTPQVPSMIPGVARGCESESCRCCCRSRTQSQELSLHMDRIESGNESGNMGRGRESVAVAAAPDGLPHACDFDLNTRTEYGNGNPILATPSSLD